MIALLLHHADGDFVKISIGGKINLNKGKERSKQINPLRCQGFYHFCRYCSPRALETGNCGGFCPPPPISSKMYLKPYKNCLAPVFSILAPKNVLVPSICNIAAHHIFTTKDKQQTFYWNAGFNPILTIS